MDKLIVGILLILAIPTAGTVKCFVCDGEACFADGLQAGDCTGVNDTQCGTKTAEDGIVSQICGDGEDVNIAWCTQDSCNKPVEPTTAASPSAASPSAASPSAASPSAASPSAASPSAAPPSEAPPSEAPPSEAPPSEAPPAEATTGEDNAANKAIVLKPSILMVIPVAIVVLSVLKAWWFNN